MPEPVRRVSALAVPSFQPTDSRPETGSGCGPEQNSSVQLGDFLLNPDLSSLSIEVGKIYKTIFASNLSTPDSSAEPTYTAASAEIIKPQSKKNRPVA
jgi:hypothetical protein